MRIILLLIVLILISSCTNLVGGPCKYETIDGECLKLEDDLFSFTPLQPLDLDEHTFSIYNLYYQEFHLESELAEGEVISCSVSVITEGTCTPWLVELDKI